MWSRGHLAILYLTHIQVTSYVSNNEQPLHYIIYLPVHTEIKPCIQS